MLEGEIPVDIGFTLPNIEWLALGGNRFTGPIPVSLANASKLQKIILGYNELSGPVPTELGSLENLRWLTLRNNMLGTVGGNDLGVISFLTNCTKLEVLSLAGNILKGPLPNSIANLSTEIRSIYLGRNWIYGIIPLGIGKLINLNLLDMQDMKLYGSIPNEIGNLYNLLEMHAGGNSLTKQIPSTIGNLTFLYDLKLEDNKLSGIITSSLGKCGKLEMLDLSQNNLNGYIPESVFSLRSVGYINLSHNSLVGELPHIGKLKQLGSLDVSGNKLSGLIPSSLGSCLVLVNLRLNNNSFEGLIPLEFSALRGLVELDLSHNKLSGTIPQHLGELPFLQILNLSYNDLGGQVPSTGKFKNASVVSVVGNKKLCGGIPDTKLPACEVLRLNKQGLYPVLGISIPLVVTAICLSVLAGFFALRFRRNTLKRTLPPVLLNNQFSRISYQELLQATDNFSDANLIGSGSFGSVYKGFLSQTQSFIALKVFNFHHSYALKSFITEC